MSPRAMKSIEHRMIVGLTHNLFALLRICLASFRAYSLTETFQARQSLKS